MNKYYCWEIENGDVYSIPLRLIALSYADYYFERDVPLSMQTADKYQEYVENTLQNMFADHEMAEDWARNNMNFNEVEDEAKLIKKGEFHVDMQDNWVNPVKNFIKEM
jgi:hypothetical protein